jgi:hypothetical protein
MYPISEAVFTALVFGLVTWAAIMATFIVGTGVWQAKRAFASPSATEPTPDVVPGDD